MIIKYDSNEEASWAKSISGCDELEITSISETRDENYIVGGYFNCDRIDLDNNVSLFKKR